MNDKRWSYNIERFFGIAPHHVVPSLPGKAEVSETAVPVDPVDAPAQMTWDSFKADVARVLTQNRELTRQKWNEGILPSRAHAFDPSELHAALLPSRRFRR